MYKVAECRPTLDDNPLLTPDVPPKEANYQMLWREAFLRRSTHKM